MYSLATINSREMKIAKSINKNVVETIRHIENKHKRSFNSIPRRFLFITSEYIIYQLAASVSIFVSVSVSIIK